MRVNLLARRPVTVRRDVPTMEVGAAVAVSVASGRRLRLCRKHGEQLIPGYGHPGGALRAILLSNGARVYIAQKSIRHSFLEMPGDRRLSSEDRYRQRLAGGRSEFDNVSAVVFRPEKDCNGIGQVGLWSSAGLNESPATRPWQVRITRRRAAL
jgi:hypothetical protein